MESAPLHDKTEKLVKDARLINDSIPDTVADLAFQLLINSQQYKQPRMNQLILYEALYNNDIPPKLRQMFNVPIPVFSGMIDTLLSDFNDQVQIKYNPLNASQYLICPKIQAHWEAERDSLSPNAMWNYKTRTDRFNATLSGRGILKEFAESDPEYRNVLETVNYSDFHCQPLGGGILENHLFCGQEGVFKTAADLEDNPTYDQTQVKKLINTKYSSEFWQDIENTYGTKLARFKSLGLDVDTNSFSGAHTYNLCEFIVTFKGERYYILFDPITHIWLRCQKWKEICPSGRYPWISWATHEDHKNFWSKSFADDLYYVADAVITMFNQELTNREKKNFNSRAFDKEMFPDVQKLDQAQFRPDGLVPADTKGGTRQIANGIYAFQTAELTGTVDLIKFTSSYTGQYVGISELGVGATKAEQKPSIVIAQQKQISKRIGFRSDSFKEAYAIAGLIFLEGMKEHMPSSVSVRIIGENGFVEEQDLKKLELQRCGNMSITVSSSSEQEGIDTMKRDGQIKAIELVAQNPNLSKYEKEMIYRNVGQFDEQEISFLIDSASYSSKKQISHASRAIQDILLNREPDIYYGADVTYLEYINQFIIDHKGKLKGKEPKFLEFINQMGEIANENMQRKASKEGQLKPGQEQQAGHGQDKQPPAPAQAPAPQQKASMSIPGMAQQMGKMVGQ